LQRARKAAGIVKPMTLHSLRHTYAAHLLEEGLDIMGIFNIRLLRCK
jgi:site-specific recombinase XerD